MGTVADEVKRAFRESDARHEAQVLEEMKGQPPERVARALADARSHAGKYPSANPTPPQCEFDGPSFHMGEFYAARFSATQEELAGALVELDGYTLDAARARAAEVIGAYGLGQNITTDNPAPATPN